MKIVLAFFFNLKRCFFQNLINAL